MTKMERKIEINKIKYGKSKKYNNISDIYLNKYKDIKKYRRPSFGSSVGIQVKIRNKKYKNLKIPKGLTDDELQDYILNGTLPKNK